MLLWSLRATVSCCNISLILESAGLDPEQPKLVSPRRSLNQCQAHDRSEWWRWEAKQIHSSALLGGIAVIDKWPCQSSHPSIGRPADRSRCWFYDTGRLNAVWSVNAMQKKYDPGRIATFTPRTGRNVASPRHLMQTGKVGMTITLVTCC